MKVLLTGAGGFIASHVCADLLRAGAADDKLVNINAASRRVLLTLPESSGFRTSEYVDLTRFRRARVLWQAHCAEIGDD